MSKRHRLNNLGRFIDQNDICLAGGSSFTNSGTLTAIASKSGTTRDIHPNCGLPGPEGKLINAHGARISATIAALVLCV
jgi:hypothetical protein